MKKFFGIYVEAVKSDIGEIVDGDYWEQYESLEGAAASEYENAVIYEMTPKRLGRFKTVTSAVKIKEKAPRKKK